MYKSAACAMYKNATVQNVQTMYYKFRKKMTLTLIWVKIKSYATIPLSISFPWAWEGEPLAFFFKNFKIPKVHLSDSIPSNPKDALV